MSITREKLIAAARHRDHVVLRTTARGLEGIIIGRVVAVHLEQVIVSLPQSRETRTFFVREISDVEMNEPKSDEAS